MSVTSNQFIQILRTYWRRPLIHLLSIFFVVSICVLAFFPSTGRSTMIGARPGSVGRLEYAFTNLDDLTEEQIRSGDMQTVIDLQKNGKAVELRSLNLVGMDVGDPLPDLSSFQNLVFLDLNSLELTDENVEQICRLPKLDALVLSNVELPMGSLERIGQKVSELEISAHLLETHSNEIPAMSKLNLLSLQVSHVSSKLLEQINQLPNLKQVTFLPRGIHSESKTDHWGGINLSLDQIAIMRNHPTLQEVYADWSRMIREGSFDEGQFLPVRALPVSLQSETLDAVRATCFAACVLFAILAIQLWAQFISPAAAVIPNFLVPHRRVAVGLFIGGSLLLTLSLLRSEISFLPSVSLVLFAPAVCCVFFLGHLSGRTFLQWLMTPVVICLILFLSIVSVSEVRIISCHLIWFLRGNMPWLATSMIGGAILVLVAMCKQLTAITLLANESYSTAPAFTPWDKDRLKTLQGRKMDSWMLRMFDSEAQGLKYHCRSTLQMLSLWRRGNFFRPMVGLWILSLVIVFGLIPQGIYRLSQGEELFSQDLRWMAGAFAGPFGIGIFLPALVWWQRFQSMEIESLRPVSRRALTKQLYFALALDHWLVVLGLVGLVVFRAFTAPGLRNEVTGLFFLLSIAAPLWILGTNASVLVCKQSWVAVGTMIVLYSLAGLGLATVIVIGSDYLPGSAEDNRLLAVSAITAIAAGIGLNVLMYRAALQREWG